MMTKGKQRGDEGVLVKFVSASLWGQNIIRFIVGKL